MQQQDISGADNAKPEIWTEADSAAATKRGFDLFDIGEGTLSLQRIDDPEDGSAPIFESDAAALAHVKESAANDALSAKILRLANCEKDVALKV